MYKRQARKRYAFGVKVAQQIVQFPSGGLHDQPGVEMVTSKLSLDVRLSFAARAFRSMVPVSGAASCPQRAQRRVNVQKFATGPVSRHISATPRCLAVNGIALG